MYPYAHVHVTWSENMCLLSTKHAGMRTSIFCPDGRVGSTRLQFKPHDHNFIIKKLVKLCDDEIRGKTA